jgi:HNH endonuclease
MSSDVLALFEVPEPISCWYCGAKSGPFEREHQVPRSRGGRDAGNVVLSCARCNDKKGELDAEQYREGLAQRLGVLPQSIVFAGEATDARPMTGAIVTVASLSADRAVVRVAPEAKEQLERACDFLRAVLGPGLTQRDLASAGITTYLDELRSHYVEDGDTWPDPMPALFDRGEEPTRFLTGRRDLARTPKVPQRVEKTSVAGDLLDWARAGVEYRRAHGEPQLQLVEWVNDAFRAALQSEAKRSADYPSMDEALEQRYGDHV